MDGCSEMKSLRLVWGQKWFGRKGWNRGSKTWLELGWWSRLDEIEESRWVWKTVIGIKVCKWKSWPDLNPVRSGLEAFLQNLRHLLTISIEEYKPFETQTTVYNSDHQTWQVSTYSHIPHFSSTWISINFISDSLTVLIMTCRSHLDSLRFS